jgi:metal-sulfur cluster biosynthetic enzyme
VAALDEVRDINVEIVWEPAWNPSMISAEGRKALGLDV